MQLACSYNQQQRHAGTLASMYPCGYWAAQLSRISNGSTNT